MSQAATMVQTTVKAATRKRRVPLGSICNNIVVVKRQRQRPPEECSFSKNHCAPPSLPDWSSIHKDVFGNILKYLPLPDILRCRAVCTTWNSSTKTYISSSLQVQQPPLLLWYEPPHSDDDCYNWFLDITRPRKNLYHINQKSKRLLRRRMGCCVGFSQGWFLFLGKRRTDRLYLFHPLLFSTAVARFPCIKTPNGGDSCKDVSKAVLLSDPILTTSSTGGGGGGLVVIHGSYRRLLYAKCGAATQFSELEYKGDGGNDDPIIITRWEDIIRIGRCLYGIATTDNGHRHMFAWEDCAVGGDTKPRQILDFRVDFKHPGGHHSCRWSFLRLVESQEGELLLVCVHVPDPSSIPKIMRKHDFENMHDMYSLVRRPDMCLVYKMDFKEKEWVRMHSLGDHRALFIMEFQAMSLSTLEFPQYKSNSIYFKHAIYYPRCSPVVGVYNLEDGSMDEIEVLS